MPRRKGDFTLGLEMMLNRPDMSPIKNPQIIKEIHSKSGMSLGEMLRYVGKGSRTKSGKPKEPSDKERSEARVMELESKSDVKE